VSGQMSVTSSFTCTEIPTSATLDPITICSYDSVHVFRYYNNIY